MQTQHWRTKRRYADRMLESKKCANERLRTKRWMGRQNEEDCEEHETK